MRWFIRIVASKTVIIGVENIIYEKAYAVFDQLLATFLEHDTYEKVEFDIKIIICSDISTENSIGASGHGRKNEYRVICNATDGHWIFCLLCDLEELLVNAMDCTVLHGGGLVFHNKTILLLGERRRGKTTLLQYLLSEDGNSYLDDDNIFMFDDSVYGFCRPMPIRNIDVCKNPGIIATTIDGDECVRTLCKANNSVASLKKVDYVFFPRYIGNSSAIDEYICLQGSAFFDKIIKNVRHSTSISSLYSDVIMLSKRARGFYFEYSSSEEAYKKINMILQNVARV